MRRTKAARKYLHGRRKRSPFKMEGHTHEEEKKEEQQVVENDNVEAAKSVANTDGSEKGQAWNTKTTNAYIDPNDPWGYKQRESVGHTNASPSAMAKGGGSNMNLVNQGLGPKQDRSAGANWGQRAFGW